MDKNKGILLGLLFLRGSVRICKGIGGNILALVPGSLSPEGEPSAGLQCFIQEFPPFALGDRTGYYLRMVVVGFLKTFAD